MVLHANRTLRLSEFKKVRLVQSNNFFSLCCAWLSCKFRNNFSSCTASWWRVWCKVGRGNCSVEKAQRFFVSKGEVRRQVQRSKFFQARSHDGTRTSLSCWEVSMLARSVQFFFWPLLTLHTPPCSSHIAPRTSHLPFLTLYRAWAGKSATWAWGNGPSYRVWKEYPQEAEPIRVPSEPPKNYWDI